MESGTTQFAGIVIQSDDPLFLTVVGLHLLAGLTAAIAGLVAMLSSKRRGRHSEGGNVYFWSIAGVFTTAAALTFLRGPNDFHLFALAAAALVLAWIGRAARRGALQNSLRLHLTAMGLSYIVLLTAFYVETGDQLPLWKELPPILFWFLPAAVGVPLIVHALFWHTMVRRK